MNPKIFKGGADPDHEDSLAPPPPRRRLMEDLPPFNENAVVVVAMPTNPSTLRQLPLNDHSHHPMDLEHQKRRSMRDLEGDCKTNSSRSHPKEQSSSSLPSHPPPHYDTSMAANATATKGSATTAYDPTHMGTTTAAPEEQEHHPIVMAHAVPEESTIRGLSGTTEGDAHLFRQFLNFVQSGEVPVHQQAYYHESVDSCMIHPIPTPGRGDEPSNTYGASSSDNDNNPTDDGNVKKGAAAPSAATTTISCTKSRLVILILIVVVIVVVAVAVAIILVSQSNKGGSSNPVTAAPPPTTFTRPTTTTTAPSLLPISAPRPVTAPVPQPSTPFTPMSPTTSSSSSSRLELFRSFLSQHSLGSSSLTSPGSVQYQALDWLVNTDPAQLSPPLSSSSIMTDDEQAQTILQRYIMALVYFNNGGTEWYHNASNFLSPNHTCEWHDVSSDTGVFCNPLQVKLGSNNIRGTIVPELGMLSGLEYLDLSDNPLAATQIPVTFTRLTNLTHLNLANNYNLAGTILTQLGQLTSLLYLNLSNTGLSGTIPTELATLTKLVTLDLNSDSTHGTLFPTQLGQLSNLEYLDLHASGLSGTIPTYLTRLTQLTHLNFGMFKIIQAFAYFEFHPSTVSGRNPFLLAPPTTGSSMILSTVPTELGVLSGLQNLAFADVGFTGTIPTEFGRLFNLTSLRIAINQLTSTIPSELAKLSWLQRMDLSSNSLTGTIPSVLTKLLSLQFLDLSSNSLTGTVPTALASLSNLSHLYLNGTGLTGDLTAFFCNRSTPWVVLAADCLTKISCNCCMCS